MLAAAPPPVPVPVQHAIVLRTPQLGYAPARVPTCAQRKEKTFQLAGTNVY